MLRYALYRIWHSILVLWGIATLVFLLFYVLPGQDAGMATVQDGDPASDHTVRKVYPANESIVARYGWFMNDLSPIGVTYRHSGAKPSAGLRLTRLDDSSYLSLKAPSLGNSRHTKRAVNGLLANALPGTVALALSAMLIAVAGGIGLGLVAALKKGAMPDTGIMAAAVAGISIPLFFAALIVACGFGYLPVDQTSLSISGRFVRHSPALNNLLLPAILLSIRPMMLITRSMRQAMLQVLSRSYIRAAYAHGLTTTRVLMRHALPNALNELAASDSGWFSELIAGTFFIEYIFGREGIGKMSVDALGTADLPVVIGCILMIALICVAANLLTDLLRGLLDQRVRA